MAELKPNGGHVDRVRTGSHGKLIGILVALASLAITLLALEVVVRIVSPQRYLTCTVNTWDPVVGIKQVPKSKGFWYMPEYKTDFVINSKGLRDREFPYAKPRGTRRILTLGDSFTCGYGVRAEETYPKVLERILRSDSARTVNWEVINAGVGSMGTANELAFFEAECYKYSPDLVTLAFFQNDFMENISADLYTLEGGKLTKHDAPRTGWTRIQQGVHFLPGYRTFSANSQLFSFIRGRLSAVYRRSLSKKYGEPGNVTTEPLKGLELTEALLIALRDACTQRGCPFVVLMVPKVDCSDWTERTSLLIQYLRQQGVTVIDPTLEFRQRSAAGSVLYYPLDNHWTKAGHELAAEVLYKYVKANPTLATLSATPEVTPATR